MKDYTKIENWTKDEIRIHRQAMIAGVILGIIMGFSLGILF